MIANLRLLWLLQMLCLVTVFSSCSGWTDPPLRIVMQRAVFFDDRFPMVGNAPLNWEYRIFANPSRGDSVPLRQLVTLMEVDFGDGEGWNEVTSEWRESLKGVTEPQMHHLFAQAGEYVVTIRATYYDGEQHLSIPQTVRVT